MINFQCIGILKKNKLVKCTNIATRCLPGIRCKHITSMPDFKMYILCDSCSKYVSRQDVKERSLEKEALVVSYLPSVKSSNYDFVKDLITDAEKKINDSNKTNTFK